MMLRPYIVAFVVGVVLALGSASLCALMRPCPSRSISPGRRPRRVVLGDAVLLVKPGWARLMSAFRSVNDHRGILQVRVLHQLAGVERHQQALATPPGWKCMMFRSRGCRRRGWTKSTCS
jgi:hypothetical protein